MRLFAPISRAKIPDKNYLTKSYNRNILDQVKQRRTTT
ncbi:hypothetical protein BACCAP_00759 [Pseudoflavonifractor capillosus ATCC 29799]|uniref:Uncharacterized protein n=1 Tax=Pseudoflavonifractor capillosus ATCC 29799 TaxID=411467 RepID=A6NRD1_9FIRM|nr:hypothetical protein BACCAP_00759 [Pseudoflavonifractor capillosus ATCC 29799]